MEILSFKMQLWHWRERQRRLPNSPLSRINEVASKYRISFALWRQGFTVLILRKVRSMQRHPHCLPLSPCNEMVILVLDTTLLQMCNQITACSVCYGEDLCTPGVIVAGLYLISETLVQISQGEQLYSEQRMQRHVHHGYSLVRDQLGADRAR